MKVQTEKPMFFNDDEFSKWHRDLQTNYKSLKEEDYHSKHAKIIKVLSTEFKRLNTTNFEKNAKTLRNHYLAKVGISISEYFDLCLEIDDELTALSAAQIAEVTNKNVVKTLNGQDFTLLVHSLTGIKKSSNYGDQIVADPSKWISFTNNSPMSTSLITQDQFLLIENNGVCIGFKNLKAENIYAISDQDIYSKYNDTTRILQTQRPNPKSVDLLIRDSVKYNYNEIVIDRYDDHQKKILPDYVVSFDEVTDEQKRFADYYEIPNVLIDTEPYLTKLENSNDKTHIMFLEKSRKHLKRYQPPKPPKNTTGLLKAIYYSDPFLRELISSYGLTEQHIKDFFKYLDNVNNDIIYDSISHGIFHSERVLLFGYIISLLENNSEIEQQTLMHACYYHDIGRIDDYEDDLHGERSAEEIEKYVSLDNCSENDIKILKGIIRGHSLAPSRMNNSIIKYRIREDHDTFKKLYKQLKDSDALDRTRFEKCYSSYLDVSFLYSESTNSLVELSLYLVEKYKEVIQSKIK